MAKKLKIAQLAPPWLRVPPKKYGGIELIIYQLCQGLAKRGHEVTLFASAGSRTSAKLISPCGKALYWQGVSWADPYYQLLHACSAFEKANDFDIIHNHLAIFGLALAKFIKTPVLTTYHGDFETAEKNPAKLAIFKRSKHLPFVSISRSQRKFTSLKLNFIATIYNGIEVDKFEFEPRPGTYLTWLGRITEKKGVLEAIEIAKRADMPLKIAAKIDKNCPPDIEFFQKKVQPLIDGKKVMFLGEIGGYKQKSDLLKKSLALLNPIKWQEPFGLVMAEAQACGTPVIVFDKGSGRELVKQGETGFIVRNISQAVRAVKNISKIKRPDCRAWVEKKFSGQRMVAEYEKVYYKLLNRT